MFASQTKDLEALRRLIERLSAPELTIGEAKVLRTQLVQVMDTVQSRCTESGNLEVLPKATPCA